MKGDESIRARARATAIGEQPPPRSSMAPVPKSAPCRYTSMRGVRGHLGYVFERRRRAVGTVTVPPNLAVAKNPAWNVGNPVDVSRGSTRSIRSGDRTTSVYAAWRSPTTQNDSDPEVVPVKSGA